MISTNQSFNESPLMPIGNNNKSTHLKMIEDTTVKIMNIGMLKDDGVVSGSVVSTAASSTKDAAIKTEEHRHYSSSFCNKTSLSKRTIATQSSSKSSFQLHNTSSKCNSNKRSSETFKLQIKEAMHKLHDLGRRKSRSEDKKKKKKKKKKQSSKDSSNSNSYELMLAELEQENRQRGQR